jgi:HEAT repeat protein
MRRNSQKTIAAAGLAIVALTLASLGYACRRPLLDHAWIGLLGFGNPPLRARAARELGDRQSLRAVPHLVRALRQDGDRPVRLAAAEALGALGPGVGHEALRALVEALETDDGLLFL